jgi:DNA-K related protein
VQGWLDQLLPFEPVNDSERFGWGFCLAQLARQTGQRGLDLDETYRDKVLARLRAAAVPAEWSRMVAEVVAMEGEERSQLFGEALPVGLRLVQEE